MPQETKARFIHFQPEKVLIPQTERGGEAPEGTQVILDDEGKVVFAGSKSDAESFISARQLEGATVHTEQGGVLLPGMIDSHRHPVVRGSLELSKSADAGAVDTLPKLKRLVQEKLKAYSGHGRDKEPFVIFSYDSSLLGSMGGIHFDEIEADVPVFYIDRSFHGGAGNTKAMAMLTKYLENRYADRMEKPAPFPGSIRGHEFSENYVSLVLELAESFQNVESVQEKLESNVLGYFSKGVTAMHEMDVMSWHQFMAYLLSYRNFNLSPQT